MSRDQRIDQSAKSIQSLLNTNGASFLMTSHIRSALWTLPGKSRFAKEVHKIIYELLRAHIKKLFILSDIILKTHMHENRNISSD